MQAAARCCGPQSSCKTPSSSFFDVVVTSLLAYESWTPAHFKASVQQVKTQTPQVNFDLQFFVHNHVLWLSCDAAPVLPIGWVRAVMKELEEQLRNVVQHKMKGKAGMGENISKRKSCGRYFGVRDPSQVCVQPCDVWP